ncbi:trypsin family protein [Sulfurifustis variabilis]|uniref:Trypsin family protein n=1 Tax=Sulfurifustis variabilis TaxID=1675686 RepID=A0A1B4V5K8_9GAMM|nr:trypsin-like peptidase domain-containing protein [Sulfurifustis variabilis]BAU48819.1 trypsin family protein [Sulfurifustis variabilis]
MNRTGFLCAALLAFPAASDARSYADVLERVNTSVVEIHTREQIVQNGTPQVVDVSGIGSGVIVSADGLVITAAHVVQSADRIRVRFLGDIETGARIVASEPAADVALLRLDRLPPSARVARLGDSSKTRVGDEVFVVGAPYGMSHTLTVGHVSGRHQPRAVSGEFLEGELFQTDAAVNQGNSGGPMFNADGEVIGIVSHILTVSGGFEGLGFAVTSNLARRLLLEKRSFWSGLHGYWLEGEMARVFNLPQSRGLLVQRIAANSPASRIGLRAGAVEASIGDEDLYVGGDIILEVLGISLADPDGYRRVRERVAKLNTGERVTIRVLRGGEMLTLSTRVERVE